MDSTYRNLNDRPRRRLSELLDLLARRKVIVASFTIFCGVVWGIGGLLLPKSYKAVIVISPAINPQSPGNQLSGGVGSLLSQFGGGFASLSGLALSSDLLKRAESVAVLQSEALTERYIEQNHLLPVLYWKIWDARNQRWLEQDPEKIPTPWKANLFFKKGVRSVVTDNKTGLVTMTIRWRDPHLAAKWANDLVALTNDYLRRKAMTESERNIDYLNAQAAKTDVLPVKQALYTLLQSEINKEMLARGNDEYAFKILDPAVPPERPSTPGPVFLAVAGVFAGFFVSVFLGYAYIAWIRD